MTLPNWESYQERLTSYNESNWPNEAPVYIKELVEAGFVYTGVSDLVFCFRCGVTAEDWKDGDEPLSRHQTLNNKCPFLVDRSIKFSSANSRPYKSLDDFERETFVYDWHPVYRTIVQRNVTTQSLESIEDGQNSCRNEEVQYRLMNGKAFSLNNPSMCSEAKRFQSFVICPVYKHWPSPEQLSSAGFYCVNDKGWMSCFCCGVEVTDWESFEQDPMQRHKSVSPTCRYVLGLPCGNNNSNEEGQDSLENLSSYMSNVVLPNSLNNRPVMDIPYHNGEASLSTRVNNMHIGRALSDPLNGMNSHARLIGYNSGNSQHLPVSYFEPVPSGHYAVPGGLRLSDYSTRLQTFLTWPRDAPVQPVELARAGFFYRGKADEVGCYECNIFLKKWDKNDRAWTEHIKHSPACPLVIEKLRERNGMGYRNQAVTTSNNVRSSHQRNLNSPPIYSFHNPYVHRTVSNPSVTEELQTQENLLHQHPRLIQYPLNRSPVWTPAPIKHSLSDPPREALWDKGARFHHPVLQYPRTTTRASSYAISPQRTPLHYQPRTIYPLQESGNIVEQDIHSKLVVPIGVRNDPRPIEPLKEREPYETNGGRTLRRTYITEHDINHVLDMGFSDVLVQDTINYYMRYSPKPFPSADALAQAVVYFQKYNSLEGSPFGLNLTYSTEDGKRMVPPKPERPLDDSSDVKICKICMDNDVEITFVPCGHLTVCQSCALDMKTCPICRLEITDTVRTYFG